MTTRQDGSAAFMVAVALLLLIAFASLAIDGSLGYDERRDLQNTADNAAYAAAYEYCNPRDSASTEQQAAEAVAAQNGFNPTDPDVTVTAVGVGDEWTVTIQVDNQENRFGAATPYANDTFTVVASGTARCIYEPFLGGYAIFAGASSCSQNELSIAGDDITINGQVHSNSDIKVTGSDPQVNGDITYVSPPGSATLSGALTASTTGIQGYPLPPEIFFEYRPGGARAVAAGAAYQSFTVSAPNTPIKNADLISAGWGTGNNTSITMTRSGIIYSDGGIDLKGVDMDGKAITFAAEMTISLEGSSDIVGYDKVDPANPNSTTMTAISWNVYPTTCAPGPATAVKVSMSAFTWEGLIFAPNGLVDFSSGSATATVDGSIIAYIINLSGSNLTVTYDDSANADPTYELDLVR